MRTDCSPRGRASLAPCASRPSVRPHAGTPRLRRCTSGRNWRGMWGRRSTKRICASSPSRRAGRAARPRLTRTLNSSFFVAIGILVSRLAGLVRQRVFAHYFGLESDAADAFTAGFRIPNFLQNLFGEGALSASFIPVYASLLAKGEPREADRVAGAVGSLLALAISVIVLVGVVATPALTAVVAAGCFG